jgi:hypothetical protein
MGHNVSSSNQQGGITAGEVNLGSAVNTPTPKKPSRLKTILKFAAWLVGLIAALITILAYLDVLA